MTISEIRQKFLAFYERQGHIVIPSASLVPENDPTTLFTGSGMQPILPYLLGQKHPQGKRLANSQKSFRSGDIDDIGDNRHTTFFEMLGNWSLGDYFKAEQLPWVFKFLTEEIGLDASRIYVTVFIGDDATGIARDTESAAIWKELFASKDIIAKDVDMGTESHASEVGMQDGRIFYYDVKKNWWSRSGVPAAMPVGEPGGPDSEIFYLFDQVEHDTKFGAYCHPNCDCGRFLEIGNSVFMEYQKVAGGAGEVGTAGSAGGSFSKLPQRNVDFGGGLERIAMASMNTADIFLLDVFTDLIDHLEILSGKKYADEKQSFRIIADHMRSAIFLISDGVMPSNAERGYFVRRLLRRAIRYWGKLGIKKSISIVVGDILKHYADAYPDVFKNKEMIVHIIAEEETKFHQTLAQGLKEFEKGVDPFILFSSYGFPIELTLDLAKERGKNVDVAAFKEKMKQHQDLSRAGSEKKFKGGLADTSEKSVQYHTATHLLNAALHSVLGNHVSQKGSNITPERLRFDFSHPTKMTDDEKKRVEDFVNDAIKRGLPVAVREMPKAEAEKLGAIHAFGEKYGEIVTVYTIGADTSGAGAPVSREFCGGPHVSNTSELAGHFKIVKEEAVSAGVRRIKAVLE